MEEMSTEKTGKEADPYQLESILAFLPELLAKKVKTLEERERELGKAIGQFETDKSSLSGDAKSSDVLHLNVGGKKTVALRRTLTSIPGSMLASQFSGRWDDSLVKDENGHFFIDQPFELFEPMLDYLRLKACEAPGSETVPSPSFDGNRELESKFRILMEYYGMTLGVFPVKLEVLKGLEYNSNIEFTDDLGAQCNSFLTLVLRRHGHDMPIRSFEITIGQVDRLQIGWKINGCDAELVEGVPKGQGVGDACGSVAIDLIRSGIIVDGNFQAVEGLTEREGSIVRCEDCGSRWYFNGRLVASNEASDSVLVVLATTQKQTRNDGTSYPYRYTFGTSNARTVMPAISARGSFKVSNIVYYTGK